MQYTQTHTFLLLVLVLFLLKIFAKQNHSQNADASQLLQQMTSAPIITGISDVNDILSRMRPTTPQLDFDSYIEILSAGTPLRDLVQERYHELLSAIEDRLYNRKKVDLYGMSNSQGKAMHDLVIQYRDAIAGNPDQKVSAGYHQQKSVAIVITIIICGMIVSVGAMYTYVYVTSIENGYCITHSCKEEMGAECKKDVNSEGCGAWLKRNCQTQMIPPPCSGV